MPGPSLYGGVFLSAPPVKRGKIRYQDRLIPLKSYLFKAGAPVMPDKVRPFDNTLKEKGLKPLTSRNIGVLQVNLGYLCNQTCAHCHVEGAPDNETAMKRSTMKACLDVVRSSGIGTVDITGGAPEMNPDYRWFVKELTELGIKVMTRTNLTVLQEDGYTDLPEFFAEMGVQVVASLPCYTEETVDTQRGEGVFNASIKALKRLNDLGYGKEHTGLDLFLVYNPEGPVLPPSEEELEPAYRKKLMEKYAISFTRLFTITNMPIGRFKERLIEDGGFDAYMALLQSAFNPDTAEDLMCRETLSVKWDGSLYDCDFNQVIGLSCSDRKGARIQEFDIELEDSRTIATGEHCYGCTAGRGSSCTGEVGGSVRS